MHEAKVATIPLAAFVEGAAPTGVVRLCHCKDAGVLAEGVQRLSAFRDALARETAIG